MLLWIWFYRREVGNVNYLSSFVSDNLIEWLEINRCRFELFLACIAFSYSFTSFEVTAWSRVLYKLVLTELVGNPPPLFYCTCRFTTTHTRARHWSVSWTQWTQCPSSHVISVTFLCVGLPIIISYKEISTEVGRIILKLILTGSGTNEGLLWTR